jgi:uncharacterized protein YutE (UPF0331/DUF86 family)
MDPLGNDILRRLFDELDRALEKLKDLSRLSKNELLEHYGNIDTAKYNFIVAIEAGIDICNRIIAKENFGYPQEYAEVIKLMGERKVLDEDLVARWIEMVKFRNLLVHLYWKIENERVYDYLRNNLGGFEAFKSAIRSHLKNRKD